MCDTIDAGEPRVGWSNMPGASRPFTAARVRSLIRLRSKSASTPIICHMARPVGLPVSIASVSERNFAPVFQVHGYQIT